MKRRRLTIAACLVFVAANVADAVITWILLSGGVGTEGNPVMAFVLAEGAWKFFALKALIPVELAILMARHRRTASATILATAFVAVCAWNMTWLLQA